ncbi:MAG TPA: murein biosynthesis integral membrane protein MurJ [Bryobacteraceae bacterium]|nr:murein biosynthesis integral membrane protein MurJ [Bryobacteraceae bacterium]
MKSTGDNPRQSIAPQESGGTVSAHGPTASEHVVRSAGIVSAAVFSSRVTGLVREIVMARLFGAGFIYDAFLLGFRIPNLTRDLFAEGALSSAFVPVFTQTLTTEGRRKAAQLSNVTGTAIILFVGTLAVLGMIFAPVLVELLAPGFHNVPGKFELTVRLTQVMFPFLLMVALAAQAMGVLNTCNRFGVPATASTFFNFGAISFGLLAGFVIGPHIGIDRITGMAIGVVIGGAIQLGWQLPAMWSEGFAFHWSKQWSNPGLRRIIHLMGPAILAEAAVQINVMVNTNFASRIPLNGPVSWLGYSFRFMQFPLGVFGVAIANATLPSIARSISQGNLEEYRRTLSRSLAMVFLLCVPSSVGLIVLGRSIVAVIYQGGAFTVWDTQQTARALTWYAVGLAGYAGLKVLNPAFYALHDSRTPMLISIASIAINYGVASRMSARFGHVGLAMSTSAVATVAALALFWILRNRIDGIYGRNLLSSTWRIIAAAMVMGAAITGSSRLITSSAGTGRIGSFIDVAISIPLGFGVFWLVSRLLKVPELELAAQAIPASWRERLGW